MLFFLVPIVILILYTIFVGAGTWGYWDWTESTACTWTGWTCYEMCSWSKWKPCHTKVHWEHSDRKNWVYNICFPWSSCNTFNAPLWLSCYTGITKLEGFSHFSSPPLMFILWLSYEEWTCFLCFVESSGALYRWAAMPVYSWWDLGVCLCSCPGPVWQLCNPGLSLALYYNYNLIMT